MSSPAATTWISVQTGLSVGGHDLVVEHLEGRETLSRLFSYQLELVTQEGTSVPFESLLGQPIVVHMAAQGGSSRLISGICKQISEQNDGVNPTSIQLELVPRLWLLTRQARSRIFQEMSVPDIVARVLREGGIDFDLTGVNGTFHNRNYVVQYRESDFNFVSRLLEDEGIYYYFQHTRNRDVMVMGNTPDAHPILGQVLYSPDADSGRKTDSADPDQVYSWIKTQELRSGKYTLRDYSFQLPEFNLEATDQIQPSVVVGNVVHQLALPVNSELEIYDYPGEYAQRFDGIDQNGAEQPAELEKVFEDSERTVGIRMEEEAVSGLFVNGRSTSPILTAGHRFSLGSHPSGDGQYVITSVTHTASNVPNRKGDSSYDYSNQFTCIPSGLPFRPPRVTRKPVVQGPQTAVVVGPEGEEIYTDPFGRVKVQFFWDREAPIDDTASCWMRVGQMNTSGVLDPPMIPRIGWEVVVEFIEGDPDEPVIVGRVYNAIDFPPVE